MTTRFGNKIKRPGAVTSDKMAACLVIKNSKTVRIKINRAIIMCSKFLERDKIFNDVGCYERIVQV